MLNECYQGDLDQRSDFAGRAGELARGQPTAGGTDASVRIKGTFYFSASTVVLSVVTLSKLSAYPATNFRLREYGVVKNNVECPLLPIE